MEIIYLGVCYVRQEDLPEFLKTGKELQVEGMMGEEPSTFSTQQEPMNRQAFIKPNNENVYDGYKDFELENERTRYEQTYGQPENQNVFDDSEQNNTQASWDRRNDGGNRQLVDIAPIRLNADGKYPCNHCQYQSTDQGNLKKHKWNIHEGVKYQCDQCQYQATQQGYLKAHKLSLHEGVKFDCDQCEYKATFTTHLTQHKKVKHEGFRFPCDECDYKATMTTYLRSHKSRHHRLI